MKNITLQNVETSSAEYVLSQYTKKIDKNKFLFLTNEDRIEDSYTLLKFFSKNIEVIKFPTPASYSTALQDRIKSISVLSNDSIKSKKNIIISSIKSISLPIEDSHIIQEKFISIKPQNHLNQSTFLTNLIEIGYQRETFVIESGQFALRGDIVDIFTDKPYRIEFFGNTVENIRIFDISSQKSTNKIQSIEIHPIKIPLNSNISLLSFIEKDNSIIVYNNLALHNETFINNAIINSLKQYMYIKFSNFSDNSSEELKFECNYDLKINYSISKTIELIKNSHKNILIAANSDISIKNLKKIFIDNTTLSNKSKIQFAVLPIQNSFETRNNIFITEKDIFKSQLTNKKYYTKNFLTDLNNLTEGDYIVHINHGIGKFQHLETIEINKIKHEFMLLIYADNDKLYLPVENINLISRYSSSNSEITLDSLGSNLWNKRRNKISKKINDISKKLIETAALRKLSSPFEVTLDKDYISFCNTFPYVETEDQYNAIKDIERDLTSSKIMDRLVCGDVGFGKTEVAIRAAFLVAKTKHQVVVLAPTTILAKQHYKNFKNRFEKTNLKVCQLSRFSKSNNIKDDIKFGNYDIIIGTKSVLSQNFKNLGLLIVDEEQHFGVKDKEHIKNLKKSIHVLTLSATPIPRTLQLSLTGIKDLSIISTPPFGKIATKTYLTDTHNQIIIDAINLEIERNGQVFVVCPHISDLPEIANFISEKISSAKIVIAHSKLSTKELESTLDQFIEKNFNVLIATNIIESGLDISSANTLIVFNAHMFGLANLYQLRGRVGRSNIQSYAYFAIPKEINLTHQAEKRLNIIKNMDKLGSGFMISTYDMDIRGAGNILGEEQSGDLKEIGVELYHKMLKNALSQIKNDKINIFKMNEDIKINLQRNVLIPSSYIEDNDTRLSIYRRLSESSTPEEFASIYQEMKDRFGTIPEEVKNLFTSIKLQIAAKNTGISKITEISNGFVIEFSKFDNITELISLIKKHKFATFIPSNKIKLQCHEYSLEDFLKQIQKISSH